MSNIELNYKIEIITMESTKNTIRCSHKNTEWNNREMKKNIFVFEKKKKKAK